MRPQNKKLYQFILILFGIFMLLGFIWLRFIRPRLPKEIPLNFSLLGFLIVLNICIIYFYILITLLRKPTSTNPILKEILNCIYLPLETLDHYLKNLSYLNKIYKRCIVFLAYNLNYYFVHTNVFYYAFEIFPRIILVMVLFTDIFGHHELSYIYKFLLVGAFILLGKYIKYSFKYAKEHFIESFQDHLIIIMAYEHAIQVVDLPLLENDEEYDIPETLGVPLKIFIEFQTTTFMNQKEYYHYMAFNHRYDDSYYTEKNLPQPRKFTAEEEDQRMKNILQLSLLIASYDLAHAENPNIKKLRILIFLNYLICWLYILLMSFPSLFYASFWELWIIFSIQDIQEPFSLTNLFGP
jgi:hypothetical protein